MKLCQVLKRPIITEKSMEKVAAGNEYVFEIERGASKHQAAAAIEDQFGVKVERVRTLTISGKRKGAGKKNKIKRVLVYKKAIVKLKAGDKIELFATGG